MCISAPVISASARAIARLAQAFVTWEKEKCSFVAHLAARPEGQDPTFWDAMEVLHAVARNVDEAYQTWQDLEHVFDKDYVNIHEHVRQAIANASVV